MQLFKRSLHYVARRIAAHVSSNFHFAELSKSITTKSIVLYDFNRWGTRKTNRKVKIALIFDMDSKIEETLAPLRARVKEQVSAIWI